MKPTVELDMLRWAFPNAAAEIDRIAAKVKEAGKHCIWGTRPPTESPSACDDAYRPLCHSCVSTHGTTSNQVSTRTVSESRR